MKTITIYPKTKKQIDLIKSLMSEMGIAFEFESDESKTKFSEKDFYQKLDKSIKQSEEGLTRRISRDEQKELLGL